MKFNINCKGSIIGLVLAAVFYAIVLVFFPLMWLEWKITNFFSEKG